MKCLISEEKGDGENWGLEYDLFPQVLTTLCTFQDCHLTALTANVEFVSQEEISAKQ